MAVFFKKYRKIIRSYFYITLGVILVAFSTSFFLNPNYLDIGGASGASVVINYSFPVLKTGVVHLIINSCLLILSLIFAGKDFFVKTAYGALSCSLFIMLFDFLYGKLTANFTQFDTTKIDSLVVILFSSIIMGYGLGITVKYGGSTGGTEIPQKIFYKNFHIPYSISLYLVDGCVILIGFFVMKQDMGTLLNEIIFSVLSGIVMDVTIFSGFNKRAVYIISDKSQEITNLLLNDFVRGVTGVKVIGEYSKNDKKMIFCVLSSFEYNKLRTMIEEIDPMAFFFCMRASEVRGEGFTYELNEGTNKIDKKF